MQNQALVSVSNIFLNEAESLQKAAESVLAQISADWHLLLVDGGFVDGSSEIAIRFAAQYSSSCVNGKFSGNTEQALLV